MKYQNVNTGEIWTIEEIAQAAIDFYESAGYSDADSYMDVIMNDFVEV